MITGSWWLCIKCTSCIMASWFWSYNIIPSAIHIPF